MWKRIVEPGRSQMTIWSMRISCWITEATYTHSEYVILTAFSLQEWLQQRASGFNVIRLDGHWLFCTSWGRFPQPVSSEDNSSQNLVFNHDLHCGMCQASFTWVQTLHWLCCILWWCRRRTGFLRRSYPYFFLIDNLKNRGRRACHIALLLLAEIEPVAYSSTKLFSCVALVHSEIPWTLITFHVAAVLTMFVVQRRGTAY
jgi:hypothetical protein